MAKKKNKAHRRAVRQAKLDKALEPSRSVQEEAPNNDLGLPNAFYSRHHVRIEQQRHDQLVSQVRNLSHDKFYRKKDFSAFSFKEAYNFVYHYLITGWKKNDNEVRISHQSNVRNGSYLISADSDLLNVTDAVTAFRHVLGFRLIGVQETRDSIYFSFQPDPKDNDQHTIRVDLDFSFPDLITSRYRSSEILHNVTFDPLLSSIPILCWYEVNEDQPDIIFHICFDTGHFLHIAYNDIDMQVSLTTDWSILKSLPDAIQVGLEDDSYFMD